MAKQAAATLKFSASDYIVYPAHGVGKIELIENQEVAGQQLQLYIIHFQRDKMLVKVPVSRALALGLRHLNKESVLKDALEIVYSKPKVKRSLWSRRAQEYETKINSGDLLQIAEVVRDLYRIDSHLTQSYSERQLYAIAIDRLCREISLVRKIDLEQFIEEVESKLAKKHRGKSSSDIQANCEDQVASVA